MKDFFGSLRFKILLGILIILLGFIIASVYSGTAAPLFSQAVSFITTPMGRFTANLSGGVSEFFNKFLDAGTVYEENEALSQELNELRGQLADYNTIKHENEQLREILGVMEELDSKIVIITATVTARDPANVYYSFTIDKGELHGVKALDPVVTSEGLVGYVASVGQTHAEVVTILDVSVGVGGYVSATRVIGTVSGAVEEALEGRCVLEYLPRESAALTGDLILTSGGNIYPRDIVIGKITKVGPSAHGTGLLAVVEPAADIRAVKNVFVITDFEGQGED
ncbi:MAG: rod shape-determining protein MreC [Oscillospiraceae bacterium]|nr:rod shape-determining protein MreC [Oscillospiraceae bacterium]